MKYKILSIVLLFVFVMGCTAKEKEVIFDETAESAVLENFRYIETDGKIKIIEYTADEFEVIIPSEINGMPVIALAAKLLEGKSLKSLKIPETVTKIPEMLCYECQALKDISWGNEITNIGDHAFYGCRSLTQITFPNNLKNIGVCAFSYTGLVSVKIPQEVEVIRTSSFSQNDALTEVVFGSGLKIIGATAFYQCGSLQSIQIPSNIEIICEGAFSGCSNLLEATFEGDCPGKFGNGVFSDTASNFIIHCKEGAKGFDSLILKGNGYKIDTQ